MKTILKRLAPLDSKLRKIFGLLRGNHLTGLAQLELDNKKIFLIILISCIIFFISVFFIKLQLQGIKNMGAKIIQLRADIDKLKKDLTTLEDLKDKETKRKQGAWSAKKIISEEQIPYVLQKISEIANQHSVKIIKIVPNKDPRNKEIFFITLNLNSNYHQFGAFLNALENADIFMAAEEIKITRNPADYFQRDVSLLLKTYVKN